jgi:type I restriction enzyme, S subunit
LADRAIVVEGYRFRQSGEFYLAVFEDFILTADTFWHYSLPAFDEGRFPKLELGKTIKSNKQLIPKNCVLLSKLNPRFPKVWIPLNLIGDRSIASTEFLICIPKHPYSLEYLYCLFMHEGFLRSFSGLVTGTSSSHQRVKPEYFLDMRTLLVRETLIQAFTLFIQPLLKMIDNNAIESRTLAALRDALLPKLMSGAVRVPVLQRKYENRDDHKAF